MALARPAYRPRDAERGVLHTVVRAHLETFLREAARRAVLGVFIRALLDFYHRQARQAGIGDGRIRLTLKTPWADGTRHLPFEPLEFLKSSPP